MKECMSHTAISLIKKDLIKNGLRECIDTSLHALARYMENDLVDLVAADLTDEGNNLEFILTVKKLDNK